MPKTVACVVVKSPKVFSWLGHMPIMLWCTEQLSEVRGVDRIVCVAEAAVAARATELLAKQNIETVRIPRDLVAAKDHAFDAWLASATGPAMDADVVVVSTGTSPFMTATKIEACLAHVTKGRCSTCVPSRPAAVVTGNSSRKTVMTAAVESVRVFRVNVPVEQTTFKTVPVSLVEAIDVDNQDEYVLADALVASNKL